MRMKIFRVVACFNVIVATMFVTCFHKIIKTSNIILITFQKQTHESSDKIRPLLRNLLPKTNIRSSICSQIKFVNFGKFCRSSCQAKFLYAFLLCLNVRISILCLILKFLETSFS